MSGSAGGRLIIVCGLPGSGKTTLARSLEDTLGAVRSCPDDWMDALGLNLHDEKSRDQIETLPWNLAEQLLQRRLYRWTPCTGGSTCFRCRLPMN
jgi:predicted kinase